MIALNAWLLLTVIRCALATIGCHEACSACDDYPLRGAMRQIYCTMCEECSNRGNVNKLLNTGHENRRSLFLSTPQSNKGNGNYKPGAKVNVLPTPGWGDYDLQFGKDNFRPVQEYGPQRRNNECGEQHMTSSTQAHFKRKSDAPCCKICPTEPEANILVGVPESIAEDIMRPPPQFLM